MKVYIESMGCDSNKADTSRVKDYFNINGAEVISGYKKADYIFLMSCGFNNVMMKENLKRLAMFSKTNAKIMLGGCIPKINKEIAKKVDYSFGPKELDKLDEIFRFKTSIKKISPEFSRADKKIIRISTGCMGKCSYCAIKLANGIVKSRIIEDIKKDICGGIKEGYRNFMFTSEDIGSWGADMGKNMVMLLKDIIKMSGDFKITLTTVNPRWFIEFPEIIGLLKSEKIEKKVYFPMQSGSDRLLRLMNREYSIKDYVSIFKKLKTEIPDIKIQSDVLIGFPTETDKDFEKTLNLIKELDIYFLQVFVYTDMKNTVSYNLKPKVPYKTAIERAKKVISCFLGKNKGQNRQLINTNIEDFKLK